MLQKSTSSLSLANKHLLRTIFGDPAIFPSNLSFFKLSVSSEISLVSEDDDNFLALESLPLFDKVLEILLVSLLALGDTSLTVWRILVLRLNGEFTAKVAMLDLRVFFTKNKKKH